VCVHLWQYVRLQQCFGTQVPVAGSSCVSPRETKPPPLTQGYRGTV
jgi:hypothetical protein